TGTLSSCVRRGTLGTISFYSKSPKSLRHPWSSGGGLRQERRREQQQQLQERRLQQRRGRWQEQ
ncbi:MAG TPA: hypothetical protein VGJ84_03300, partial [Polyangiaceae bacterium]